MMRFLGAVVVPVVLMTVALVMALAMVVLATPAMSGNAVMAVLAVLALAWVGFAGLMVKEWLDEREWREVMREEDRRHRAQMAADRALIAESRKGTARAFKEVAKTKEMLGLMQGGR